MNNTETGGPAFPGQYDHGDQIIESWIGMTLRDYFAAKAMQAVIATAPDGTTFGRGGIDTNLKYANASYAIADAMLEARKS